MIAFVRMLIEEAAVLVALGLVLALIFVWSGIISHSVETSHLRQRGYDALSLRDGRASADVAFEQ